MMIDNNRSSVATLVNTVVIIKYYKVHVLVVRKAELTFSDATLANFVAPAVKEDQP